MISLPFSMTEPVRRPTRPMMAFSVVDAAGAVAAEQGDQLAAVHRQVDAVQDVRLAVEGVQVGDAQHLDIWRVMR